MNKEKQICKHFKEEVCSKLDCKKDCKYYGKANCKNCIHEDICQLRTYNYCEEEVKEKGCAYYQPKLPEDSVVLSREEYDTLKAENDKYVKDCIDYFATINKLENKVWKVEQQARKETAEKILERGKYCMPSGLREWIIEQFGVQIKD